MQQQTEKKYYDMPNYSMTFKRVVWNRIHIKKLDCIIAIVGTRRMGKSYIGLNICESLDPGFNAKTIQDRVFANPLDFMKLVMQKKETMYPGMAIMFDEVGVGLYAREWYDFMHRGTNKMMQIFGHKNFLVVFTLNNLNDLDKGAKRYVHYLIITKGINRGKRQSRTAIKYMDLNPETGDVYSKYFRKRQKNRPRINHPISIFKKPSRALCNAYERMAGAFKQQYVEELYYEAKKSQEDAFKAERKTKISEDMVIEKIIQMKEKYAKIKGGRMLVDSDIIAYDFKITPSAAKRVKKIVEHKFARLRDEYL